MVLLSDSDIDFFDMIVGEYKYAYWRIQEYMNTHIDNFSWSLTKVFDKN